MSRHLLRNTLLAAVLIPVILFSAGCKKKAATSDVTVPVITTTNVIINLTSTTAQSGGTITSYGDATITANGVCYSTTDQTPTTTDTHTTDSVNTSTYIFSSNLIGLSPNTKYYLRAYATNTAGTGYGSVVTFTTSSSTVSFGATSSTFAGNGVLGYTDGAAASAQFNNPQGIVTDAQGNVYVADTYNNVIRKISTSGIVSTFAGNGTIGNTDGPGASAEFYGPQGMVMDAQGNIYVADAGNNVIREISPSGMVSTFAGNNTFSGFLDGQGVSARFNSPHGLAFDSKGYLYVADRGNNNIRRISPTGLVTTISGSTTAGYVNATAGIVASFNNPTGVAVDATGDIFVCDQANNAIREITPAGVVTTVAGGPTQASDVGFPASIIINSAGNFFISDESGRIMELTSTNVLYVLAGKINTNGYYNSTGSVIQFNSPQGIALDNQGSLYVADSNNNYIRKLVLAQQ